MAAGILQTFYLGIPSNVVIGASMAGTAAATVISSSISVSHARQIQVFNLTGRNLELIIGGSTTPGTADFTPGTPTIVNGRVLFCPGTASAVAIGHGIKHDCIVNQGMGLWVRTTENTPITCASTTPLVISLWV